MTTGIIFAPATKHTLARHPEHAGRLQAVWTALQDDGILPKLVELQPVEATLKQLQHVHDRDHIALVEWSSKQGNGRIGADTYTTSATFQAAKIAAGSCCQAVDAIATGLVDNALALVRPPGHHAGARSIEGFCLFNNIAIAARHAQVQHAYNKVAIIDFDVHHGNGTQDIFYQDESVLFCSLQMFAPYFYPGSGGVNESGRGKGAGMTVNVPFPPGVGDEGYLQAFDTILEPLLQQFQPEMLLISVGFDGHWRDPLAYSQLSLAGYDQLCRRLLHWADQLCGGKILFVLEGGYDLEVLGAGVLNLARALVGKDMRADVIGKSAEPEPDITNLLLQVQKEHLLGL